MPFSRTVKNFYSIDENDKTTEVNESGSIIDSVTDENDSLNFPLDVETYSKNFTVKVKSGYVIIGWYIQEYGYSRKYNRKTIDKKTEITISDKGYKKSASGPSPGMQEIKNYSYYIEIGKKETDTEYQETLEHCYSSFTGQETIPIGTTEITFYANEGFVFNTNGTLRYDNGLEPDYNETIPSNSENVLTYKFPEPITSHTKKVIIDMKASRPIKTVSGFSNIYLTNGFELNQLSLERYIEKSGKAILDYGKFITNLFSIPFEIPEEQLNKKDFIQLGTYKSEVESKILNDNILNVNIGNISIPEKYQNVFDYKDVSTRLILPYVKPIDVDVENIINKQIEIHYLINLYNGKGTINVTNNDNVIVYNDNTELGSEMPFIQLSTNDTRDRSNIAIDNGIRTAYIEVSRKIPIIDPQGYETLEAGKLKEYTDYIEASDIKLDTTASTDEQSQIKRLLRNGVII